MDPNSTAIVPYQGKPTAEVQSILKQIVADKSRERYVNQNIIFMLWIFDNESLREELLHDWALGPLYAAAEEDKLNNTH